MDLADRSVVDLVSQWGQCDFPMRPNGYWKGNTWDDAETLWQHSPLTYAANCTTPVLLIHSEGDWRCPIGQSQELFSALKRLGKCPVELVWGGGDTAAPPAVAVELAALLPNAAPVIVLPGVGHLTPTEAPDALRAAVERHL